MRGDPLVGAAGGRAAQPRRDPRAPSRRAAAARAGSGRPGDPHAAPGGFGAERRTRRAWAPRGGRGSCCGLGRGGRRLLGAHPDRGLRGGGRRAPHGVSSDRPGGPSSAGQGVSPAPSQLTVSQDVSLGSSRQVWSDYLNMHLHPKSVYVIPQYMHDGDCGCLEAFGQGESLLQDPGCLEELEDRLHFYVEECDYLQGFQVLCDLHNGFSGVGAKVTELLCDEYSGKGILTWGLTPVTSNVGDSQKNFYRLMNTALGIVHLSSHSSLFCPLSLSGSLGIRPRPPVSFPYINYDASLNYHSSAILAAVLDTLTAPYRLSSFQGSMMHLAETLNFSGRKVVAAWASVPFPALRGCSLFDTLCTYKQDVPWKLLSSCREQKVSCCFAQSVVLRGICKESHLSSCSGKQPESLLHMWESTEQILQRYLHTVFPGAFRWVTGCRFGTGSSNWPTVLSNVIPLLPYSTALVLEQPCHTQPPYPQFFSPLLTREGFLLDRPPRYPSAAVESIPVLAALQASPVLHTLLYSLYKDLQKLNTQRWASFFSAGVEHDDFQEALEQLRTLSQCYETGFEADESEDEGDSD
ncbi:protein misato homolog 1 isoform X6 [Apus apus]|uniref:protein misato homolog 1 isoform X6 n=1 Tax=Apus apus TaxID=8895 RepID=UPI0021F8F33A|nr:protein misato homolog 1 isoform X6 [Apus apus]